MKIVSLVIACAAFAITASVALGAPPEQFTDVVDYSGSASCGTFNDMAAVTAEIAGVTTFDAEGNPVRDVVHIGNWERNWRSGRPSVSITAKRSFTVIYTYATDTETNAGGDTTSQTAGTGGALPRCREYHLQWWNGDDPWPSRRFRGGRCGVLQRTWGSELSLPFRRRRT